MELTDADLQTIRERAYFKWLDAGAPSCDGVEYWLGAECEYLHDDGRIQAERAAGNQRDKGRTSTRKVNQRVQRSLADEEETIGSLD